MSFQKLLTDTIEDIIKKYTHEIANKYDLEQTKLLSLWNNTSGSNPQVVPPQVVPSQVDPELTPEYLLKCKKPELQLLCKKRGLKYSGTKAQLIGYLQGKTPVKSKSKPKNASKNASKNSSKTASEPSIIKKVSEKVPIIAIRKNQYGNHVHPDTNIVFDTTLKKAVGVQQTDGTIKSLTKEDIDKCNQYKFDYVIPTNLDTNKLDESITELDSEEELLTEEEIIEEEEEIIEEDEEIVGGDYF